RRRCTHRRAYRRVRQWPTTTRHHTRARDRSGRNRSRTWIPDAIIPCPRTSLSLMPGDSDTASTALEALIQRCLRGDQTAWELIVKQHWRKVFNVAYKFVGKHDEAEDLTQDIFDRRANFQTWLISVSRNLCIDHYRSVRKERETIDRQVDANELTPAAPEAGPIAA